MNDHSDRSFSPALARRVLRSQRQNGDLVTDLDTLTCRLAAAERRTYTTAEAREVAAREGLSFDQLGWAVAR